MSGISFYLPGELYTPQEGVRVSLKAPRQVNQTICLVQHSVSAVRAYSSAQGRSLAPRPAKLRGNLM
jgi:hypothetical protein